MKDSSPRPIPLLVIILIALAIHGPLLLMQLPAKSYDTNLHIFFASHYAQHWFNPWNEKWFAGFSQTTYPPLAHQWIALLSFLTGLTFAYMVVQLAGVLLLVVGVYRFSRLWVGTRAASYAAFGSVFVGAVSMLVYSAGQLPTVLSTSLYLNALPYFYHWSRQGGKSALLKGVVLGLAAASVHHVTLLFGSSLFALPVIWLAYLDRNQDGKERSAAAVLTRAGVFAVLMMIGTAVVLLPYWISIIQHPIEQVPIPHSSRTNLLLDSKIAINHFLVPYGALLLLLPWLVIRGSADRRLRPLVVFFWVAFIFGLGGTTPLPRILLRRAYYVLTFERFTLLAALLALPLAGLLAAEWIDRFRRPATLGLSLAAIGTLTFALAWIPVNPYRPTTGLNVDPVINFLNHDGHDKYRYLTLGFGNDLDKVSTYAVASSVDGESNSARLLPEMTRYGAAQFTSAKFYGSAGMESLRAMLKHADHYGLKYIFVHDRYYEPLLAFAGWRQIESYGNGEIRVWVKDDAPPARRIPSDAIPAPWEGVLWGTLPIGTSFLAIILAILLPERRKVPARVETLAPAPAYAREA